MFVLLFSRRREGSAGSRWELVSNLHGRHHRLRAAGVWSHGHLHQVREEDERVPHLQAVCSTGRARLQVLSWLCTGHEREGEPLSVAPRPASCCGWQEHVGGLRSPTVASCTWFVPLPAHPPPTPVLPGGPLSAAQQISHHSWFRLELTRWGGGRPLPGRHDMDQAKGSWMLREQKKQIPGLESGL